MSNYSDSSFDESNHNTSWYKVYSLVPEGVRVLDVGCSSGNFGEILIQKKHCQVDGIELDKSDAKLAAKKLGQVWTLNVEYDDLRDIPAATYDIIYFGDVVEHLVQPTQTLQRMRSLLSKKGAILFSIPNMGHISVRLELLQGNFDYTETGLLDKTHLHFYTQKEVVRVFNEAGYDIEQMDFVQKDYPKALLKQYLKKYGMSADETFYERMQATDASTFQFIGVARPAKVKHHKLQTFGPIDLFETFHTDTVKGHEIRIAELEQALHETKQRLDMVQGILNHKEAHPYRAVAGHLKKKIQ
jgi:2-polyprenyl-3-methyl-5-hydroxy-6-metoxy-1,4-benzoquinol methylase